jgi:hypothetical protein
MSEKKSGPLYAPLFNFTAGVATHDDERGMIISSLSPRVSAKQAIVMISALVLQEAPTTTPKEKRSSVSKCIMGNSLFFECNWCLC